ncbi:MAG: quinone-dependent dihydroorotate dehydrogenase [Flavobacteriales bacterium]|nr:quinone-dependent dihydroorotate dehydrogenase [Flavobacteriales bacterium]
MYRIIRPLLFLLPPERAHRITFALLDVAARVPGMLALAGGRKPPAKAAVEVMGLCFPSPVGLAAGMDKDAKHVDALSALGFGHIEIGTVTPLAQPGNERPRLFRLPKDLALINRMGFNNGGVEAAVRRLKKRKPGILVGGNIGRNKATPNERAVDDYVKCFEALHPVVDYFTVNVSSPNTAGLRELQDKGPLLDLLRELVVRNAQPHRPILLKIAPDLSDAQLDDVCVVVKESGIAGVIATNTTISREGLRTPPDEVAAMGMGGLSGVPVRARSTEVVRYLRERLPRPMVIIGVGGIDSAEAAMEKIQAGADPVQVYTGLIYEGPALISRINEAFVRSDACLSYFEPRMDTDAHG